MCLILFCGTGLCLPESCRANAVLQDKSHKNINARDSGFTPYLVLFQRIFLSPKFAFFIDSEAVLDVSIFKGVRITSVSPAFSRGL